MRIIRTCIGCLLLVVVQSSHAQLQAIELSNLDAFDNPGRNWVVAGDISTDYNGKIKTRQVNGTGVLMNHHSPKNQSHLITKQTWGDMELEFEFMMFKNSNSGVYLQGRYEIQLYDSWKRLAPTWYDVGAIYARYHNGYSYEGTQPIMNVAKAPGLWQKMQIRFRAPRFNAHGEKITNARFESVRLNGVVIISEVEVTGPTRAALFPDTEAPTGPLMFQGDHGPVAFRNIKYGELVTSPPAARDIWDLHSSFWKTEVNPLIVTPTVKPEIIRTFLKHGDSSLTHVLSVGSNTEVNYSYNLKQGNIFQFWRGRFLNVAAAWWDRGWMQLGVPLGAVISLPNTPVVANLFNNQSPWPGALAFDSMHHKGYILDKAGHPTFLYSFDNLDISDKIDFHGDADGLYRTITVNGATHSTYCRLASGKKIEKLTDELYVIDDKSYYIQLDKKLKPVIRKQGSTYELLLQYSGQPITYQIIW